jgi:hypothetical protein
MMACLLSASAPDSALRDGGVGAAAGVVLFTMLIGSASARSVDTVGSSHARGSKRRRLEPL